MAGVEKGPVEYERNIDYEDRLECKGLEDGDVDPGELGTWPKKILLQYDYGKDPPEQE